MNREIKFRGLKDDMSNCNWVYGSLVYSNGIPRISNDEGLTFHSCVKGTEGQYTGLKDKNGVDIYEGDIVKSQLGKVGLIEFNINESRFIVVWENGGRNAIKESVDYIKIKVIGNIKETPELII